MATSGDLDLATSGDFFMATDMVEPVDVGQGRPLDVFQTAPGTAAVDQLPLVEAVEGLSEDVVVGSPRLLTEAMISLAARRSL